MYCNKTWNYNYSRPISSVSSFWFMIALRLFFFWKILCWVVRGDSWSPILWHKWVHLLDLCVSHNYMWCPCVLTCVAHVVPLFHMRCMCFACGVCVLHMYVVPACFTSGACVLNMWFCVFHVWHWYVLPVAHSCSPYLKVSKCYCYLCGHLLIEAGCKLWNTNVYYNKNYFQCITCS